MNCKQRQTLHNKYRNSKKTNQLFASNQPSTCPPESSSLSRGLDVAGRRSRAQHVPSEHQVSPVECSPGRPQQPALFITETSLIHISRYL